MPAESSDPPTRIRPIADGLAIIAGLVTIAIACGRALHAWPIQTMLPASPAMTPLTALGLLATSIGLWLSMRPGKLRSIGRACLGAVAIVAAVSLLDLLFGFGIARESAASQSGGDPLLGRTTPMSALSFVLLATGTLLSDSNVRSRLITGQSLIVVVMLCAVNILFGYAYEFGAAFGEPQLLTMSLEAAVLFSVLAAACILAQPKRGIAALLAERWPRGPLLRHLMPILLLAPLIIGWMAVFGPRGTLPSLGAYAPLVATGGVALLVGFMLWSALSLRQYERELKLATEDLASSEEMFRASFENAVLGMAYLDASRRWIRVNARFSDLLGYEPDELLAHTLKDVVHGDDLAALEQGLNDLQTPRGEPFRGAERLIDRRGEVRWFDFRVTALRNQDGTFRHFIFVVQDITEARRTAEQLRIQARSMEAAGTGIIIADARLPDQPIVYVNSTFERLTGYERDEVLGRNPRFLNRLAREQPALEELRRALREGEPCTVVLENHTKSGVAFWNELTITPLVDETGAVTHFIGIQNDVTKLRAMTTERESLLRTALEDRNRAVDATRARDVLLTVVSHELRSPLNSIRLWASLLQTDARRNESMIEKALQQIESGVEAQSRLINDLLDASRIASGKLELERERVDMRALVADVVTDFERIAEGKHLCIAMECPNGGIIVDGDRVRLRQAVSNLVDNAVKFTPARGRVDIVIGDDPSHFHLCVRDTGIGIDPDHLPHIFDQFWQVKSPTNARQGGLGLGLHIVKHVVERHGGSVSAESTGPGAGSSFSMELPLAGAQSVSKAIDGGAARNEPVDATGDVLVVDDEVDSAEALTLALRIHGLDVRVAFGAPAALAAIENRRPRVLVSDLSMPEMDGFELVRHVRAQEQAGTLTRIRAIAITGRGTPSDRWRARRAGFDEYLSKPVRVQDLFKRITHRLSDADVAHSGPLSVWVLGPDGELAQIVRQAGHTVAVHSTLADAVERAEHFVPEVLLIDFDAIAGDVERFVHGLRENRLSLFVIGIARKQRVQIDHEVYDYVLPKPVQREELVWALRQAQEV
jgi:PAS domain S-box-containing protein